MIKEIKAKDLNAAKFIDEKVKEIRKAVGRGVAINALSGGVDSSVVTALGHRALGDRLRTYYIDTGLMRQNEGKKVTALFNAMEIRIEIAPAAKEFFKALRGITDPELKREAITQTFYRDIFRKLIIESGARHLFHGTILTDVDETAAGIKRQHNIFAQIGIDPQREFGYKILEPLVQLRKDGVRKVGQALGLPETLFNRIPFPGPALAARIIGEVTPERVGIVRKATSIVEKALEKTGSFQHLAILHEDRVTGMRDGRRVFGMQVEVRCWESLDARIAAPTRLPFEVLEKIAGQILEKIPGVVSVTYNIAPKPPSTIEAV